MSVIQPWSAGADGDDKYNDFAAASKLTLAYALCDASKDGYLKTARAPLDAGADVDQMDGIPIGFVRSESTPLLLASEKRGISRRPRIWCPA